MCKRLCNHFQKGTCKNAEYKVEILEVLSPGTTAAERRKKETEWILKLRTAYPYGLNGKIGENYHRFDDEPIGIHFPALKREKSHPNRSRNTSFSPNNSCSSFLSLFYNKLQSDLSSCMNFGRTVVTSLSKKKLKELAVKINDFLNDQPDDFIYLQWYLALLDIIETKLYRPKNNIKKSKKYKSRLNVLFVNKGVDIINIAKILKYDSVVSKMPIQMTKEDIPMVTYKLMDPIRSKLFNHKTFVNSLNIDEFLLNKESLPCHCEHSSFKDPNYGHIITGDLRFVQNNKLRKLICKGPKYREPEPVCWIKAKSSLVNGLEETITALSNKFGITKLAFQEWKSSILQNIDFRISKFKTKFENQNIKPFLKNSTVRTALNDLHNNFVLAPIDKAANNVSFICKRFYAETLLKEFGVLDNNSRTYQKIIDTKTTIIDKCVEDLKSQFSLTVKNNMKTLPTPYWLPKMHKTPIGSRFIIASKSCTVKELSKKVTAAFKLVYKAVECYHNKSRYYSGVNSFWVIQNNSSVIENINKLTKRNAARSVNTYDFSTLYTNIPHDKLIETLNHVIDFSFKGRTQSKISINDYNEARWCKSSKHFTFNIASLKKAFAYIIRNCYFSIGEHVFKQIIGIPMGSDPAPFFANLFLFYFEMKWMENLKKDNFVATRKYCNTFRFIDDLITINNAGHFEKNIEKIYPPELHLKKENVESTSASFLDLKIKIENSKFTTSLYDKRDNFNFDIVRMPFRKSNIPQAMFYATINAEILRIGKATSVFELFCGTSQNLLERMKKQGANHSKLRASLKKMLNRHQKQFSKFNKNNADIINRILYT